jgi:muramoyltetrapeptide carboxypeptidase
VTIFIDPPAWPAHGRLWAHLVSDESIAELHEFAAAHGVPRRGFERDHYDVPAELYGALVAAGAVPTTARGVIEKLTQAGLRKRKATAMSRKPPGRELLRPPRLRSGDLVAVPAVSGALWEDRLAPGVARLESWGLRVRVGIHAFDGAEGLDYLAAEDADRAADFTHAWHDPDIAGIVVARGGFGAQRMVDLIDWRRLAEGSPKVVVGFSDVTALHSALASRLGLASVHGHVVTSLGAADAASADGLRRVLMAPDEISDLLTGLVVETLVPGVADGVLLGGNLMILSADVGTATMRPARGAIVILEEVNEEPYRIDRQLTQLQRSGWFEGVRGIVCGAFTDCGDPAEVMELLRRRLMPLGVPTVAGVDLGHTTSTITVPLGVRATLDAGAGSLTLARPPLT